MNYEKIKRPTSSYRGRFAPSPSGYLHFGSLIAALASYLDAKKNNGTWLVRIEDIDPPREKKGASKAILETLEAYGLHWDEKVLYQSNQQPLYQDYINELLNSNLAYYCQCTRAQIKTSGGIYQGTCRNLSHQAAGSAIRVKNNLAIHKFSDLIQGHVECNMSLAQEDFTIFRKDGLFAYQLAVVVDDLCQNISHVIRGCDLLEPTVRQLSFFKLLNSPPPAYGHFPLAVTELGYKLSKQNKAPAINVEDPRPSLITALSFLGQEPARDLASATVEEIIQWATKHWCLAKIPKRHEIEID